MNKSWLDELTCTVSKEKIFINESMKNHTSFKIGGPAEVFVRADCIDDVKQVILVVNKYNVPLHIVGNGSNLLVHDEGVKGIVLKIEMKKISLNKEENVVYASAECGATLATVAYELLQNGVTGFEELAGIPGTVGGAIRMNAGAHGKEMKDVVVSTMVMDMNGSVRSIAIQEHEFEYRNSIFSRTQLIVLESKFRLQVGDRDKILAAMDEYSAWRRDKQPLEYPNAGSTFKRGEGYVTARLIDECGLKGHTVGGAQVSTKHAGFIVNTGNATAKDVLELVDYVKKEVYNKTGKIIELEVQVI